MCLTGLEYSAKRVMTREIVTRKVQMLEDSNAGLPRTVGVVEDILTGLTRERFRALESFNAGFIEAALLSTT